MFVAVQPFFNGLLALANVRGYFCVAKFFIAEKLNLRAKLSGESVCGLNFPKAAEIQNCAVATFDLSWPNV